MPLGLPNEFGIKGRVFTDFGTLTGVDGVRARDIHDTGSLRLSAGAGVSWEAPFGVIGVDLGQAILKKKHDKTERIQINFGTRF